MTQLIVGLGNPGGEYAKTRHNVGRVAQELVESAGKFKKGPKVSQAQIKIGDVEGYEMTLAIPGTFMNLSGQPVAESLRATGSDPADLLVIHDDVDLPFGRLQVRRGGSAGGHNGLRSIIDTLGREDFVRVRVGVGRPPEGVDTADYVLRSFSKDERVKLKAIVERAAKATIEVVKNGVEAAANLYNRDTDV